MALKLYNSFFNMDIIINEEENVYIIEVAARSGGAFIPEIISRYFGIDIFEKMILNSLGNAFDFPIVEKSNVCVSELILSEKSGIIADISSTDNLLIEDIEVLLGKNKGDFVNSFSCGADLIGGVIACGSSVNETKDKIRWVKENIIIKIDDIS